MNVFSVLQVAVGVVLCAMGLVLAVRGRSRLSRKEGAAAGAWVCLGPGIALLGLGYHLAGWGLPQTWVPLKAPVQHWWLVVGISVAVAICGWRLEADGRSAADRV